MHRTNRCWLGYALLALTPCGLLGAAQDGGCGIGPTRNQELCEQTGGTWGSGDFWPAACGEDALTTRGPAVGGLIRNVCTCPDDRPNWTDGVGCQQCGPNPNGSSDELPDLGRPRSPVVLFVREAIQAQLRTELARYKSDVEHRFPVTMRILAEAWPDERSIRNRLQELYAAGEVTGAVLVGLLPYHRYYWQGAAVPHPFYYENLDGSFSDADRDGLDDHVDWGAHDGPEIWVANIRPLGGNSEVAQLRKFFDKTHAYYVGQTPIAKRALVFITRDWQGSAPDMVRSLSPIYGQAIDSVSGAEATVSKYRELLQSNPYELVNIWTHAGGNAEHLEGGALGGAEIARLPQTGLLTMIWGCHAGDWHEAPTNNVALSYAFGDHPGQAAIAVTRSIGLSEQERAYEALAEGLYLGEAYFRQKRSAETRAYVEARWPNEATTFTHDLALVGNPFLYLRP